MTEIDKILEVVCDLTSEELQQLAARVQEEQKLRQTKAFGLKRLAPEDLARLDQVMAGVQQDAAEMSEEEAFRAIDDAIDEVIPERLSRRDN